MAEILAVKSLSGGVVVGGFQSIAWSQPQSGLAVTTMYVIGNLFFSNVNIRM